MKTLAVVAVALVGAAAAVVVVNVAARDVWYLECYDQRRRRAA